MIEIETRIAHQEHYIAELNDALVSQQVQIAQLELQVRALVGRVKAMAEAAPGGSDIDETPPHY